MKQIVCKFLVASAAVAAIALASNSAMAESKVNVPFSFTVGHKKLPAGQYTILRGKANNTVTLTSQDSSFGYTWILAPGDPSPYSHAIVLKFDSANETHFLRSVQYGPQTTPRLDRDRDRQEHPRVDTVIGQ
jgi:hypothetical protein